MNKFYLIFPFISLLFFSCSEDEDQINPTACIQASKEVVEVGETITFTNCSENFSSFEFSYYNRDIFKDTIITEPSFELSFAEPGEYSVNISVTDAQGTENSNSVRITVNEFEEKLRLINLPTDFEAVPIGAGVNEENGNLYYIASYGSDFNNTGYYYYELDEDFKQTSQIYLRNRTENSGAANLTLLENGDKLIQTINTFSDSYFSRDIVIDTEDNVTVDFSDLGTVYGNIDYGQNMIYYGSSEEYNNEQSRFQNFAAIEIRDKNYNLLETKVYKDLEFANVIIASMISSENGYIAYGGTFSNEGSSLLSYQPILIFLNDQLEIIDFKVYTESKLSSSDYISYNSLNSKIHFERLSSGKLVAYGLGEIRILDEQGNEIFDEILDDFPGIDAFVSFSNSFIVSTRGFLTKFDDAGNIIKRISAKNDLTPSLIKIEDKIYFISAYQTTNSSNAAIFQPFIGAINENLEIINLN